MTVGADAASAIVAEPEAAQLTADVRHVLLGGDPRVLTGLHGVLLGGEAEGVEAHRIEHVVARGSHVAGVHVGGGEPERVTHV